MLYSMKTDKGVVRDMNQDNCYVAVFENNSCFGVVCDGMGGPKAGDVASEIAIKEIADRFTEGWNGDKSIDDARALLTKAIKTANLKILALSESNEMYEGMGTTVVAAFCKDDDVIIANVGDSRAYVIDDEITQISKDHSLLQELMDKGKISSQQAINFPAKNVITRALGIDNHVDIDFYSIKLNEGCLLLCSDGLYNFADENDIKNLICNSDKFNMLADELVQLANSNGGGDNITAVLIKR